MEIIALIFILWLIGCAFPGSSGGYFDGAEALALLLAFIASVALVFGYFAALTYAAFFVTDLTGDGWLGAATFVALFVGTLFANKCAAEASDRRKARAALADGGK